MDKDQTLHNLKTAINAHLQWVENIKLLIEGESISADTIQASTTECGFGSWFYDEGQRLSAIKTIPADSMALIDSLHNKLHDVYINIYKIYFDVEKKSLIKRLISRKKKVDPKEIEMAKAYLKEIEKLSFDFMEELSRLERRTSAFPESDFELL